MFFLAGAASSVLDLLGSLQGGSGAQKSSAAGTATSGQTLFNISAPAAANSGATADSGATSAGPTGNMGGCWSCSETMSALLSVQSQSAAGATGGTAGANTAGSNVLGTIEQVLTALENQIGAGQATTGSDGSSDSTQGPDGPHHHHASGIEQLLQALDSQSGTGQSATNADGSTLGTGAVGSVVMAPGTGFPFSAPFSWSSGKAWTSTGSTSSGLGTLPVNPLGRLINLQAQMFAAATAGQNLSTIA
jgi:hypothetical protein